MTRTLNTEIARIKRYIANGLASDDLILSDNEIELYWTAAAAAAITKYAYSGYQIDGCLALADGFLTTFKYSTVSEDADTGDTYLDLAAPPLGLPLGYSVDVVEIAGKGTKSKPLYPVQPKRVAYFRDLPKPTGGFYWVENNRMFFYPKVELDANEKVTVRMMNNRVTDRSAVLNLPDDLVESIFLGVVNQIRQRYSLPQDNSNEGTDTR